MVCSNCGRRLGEEDPRPVPAPVIWLTSLAFAFFHGGLWAHEGLKRPYCARCRGRIIPLAVLMSLAILAGAAGGIFLLFRAILRSRP